MKLWCFLHAFQKSPYRYLYLSDVLKALESSYPHSPSVDSVLNYLRIHSGSDNPWWDSLQQSADELEKSESLLFDPNTQQFIFYGQKEFPVAFMNCSNPPLALSVEGPLKKFNETPSISVVGSREPHEFSSKWMQKEFYGFLKRHSVPVISGGARGIDQLAHRIALLLDLPTLVILPSGLSQKYPTLWNPSGGWVSQGATFMSEMLLGARISKQNFSSRNRLIAAFGAMTLIVEARAKSGTIMTAHHALIEGKSVCVVPGHPWLTQFAGSLQLLTEGGVLVRNALDLGDYFKGDLQICTETSPQLV